MSPPDNRSAELTQRVRVPAGEPHAHAEARAVLDILEQLTAAEEILGAQASALVKDTCRDVRERLARSELCAVVFAEHGRAAFLNALVGARVFEAEDEGSADRPLTFLRRGKRRHCRAIFEDGCTSELDGGEIEPSEAGDAVAHAELETAQNEVRRASGRVTERTNLLAERQKGLPRALAERPPWWAFWLWVLRLLLWPFYFRRVAAVREIDSGLADAEGELSAAGAVLEKAQRAGLQRKAQGSAMKSRFAREVGELTDPRGRGRSVRALHLEYPAPELPEGVTLIDAAAAALPAGERRERAWDVIRRDADACIVVQDAGQRVAEATRSFVQELRASVPHVVLASTSADRGAAARFAAELPREPDDIVPALQGHGPIPNLAELLRLERDAVIAARLGFAARTCVLQLEAVQQAAEAAHRQRLAQLEGLRIPRPEEYKAQALAKVREELERAVAAVVASAQAQLKSAMADVAEQWVAQVQACASKDALKDLTSRLGKRPEDAALVQSALQRVERVVASESRRLVWQFATPTVEELAERRRVARGGPPVPGAADEEGPTIVNSGGVRDAIVFTDTAEAAATAASGASVGTLAALVRGLDALKQECAQKLRDSMPRVELRLFEEIASSGPTIALGVESALVARLASPLAALERQIAQRMQQERQGMQAERARLAKLAPICAELSAREERLAELQRENARAMTGLAARP